MALSAATVWEIRPATGASANGGGFVAGATGTDFSQQDAAQYSGTNLAATNANTSAPSITSASHTFVAADVGNLIHITAGTSWTVGYYQILSVSAGAATLDRACASVASPTLGTFAVGGAAASVANISASVVAGNILYQKGGANDTLGGTVTLTAGTIIAPTRWEGYATTRGDIRTALTSAIHTAAGFLDTTQPGAWPVVDIGANLLQPQTNCLVTGIKFIGSRTATSTQINCGSNTSFYRCVFAMTGVGPVACVTMSTRSSVRDCDFAHVGQAGQPAINAGSGLIKGCRITSTSGGGITIANGSGDLTVAFCLFYSMAASQTAITNGGVNNNLIVLNNTFDNIAGSCVSTPALTQATAQVIVDNNQVTNCGTFLTNLQSATQAIAFLGHINRIRNTTTSYTGWFDNSASSGDITTAQTDAAEYKLLASQDYRLLDGAKGQGLGSPGSLDTGCFQRKEPTLPTAAQVLSAVGFGDFGTEFTGTVVQPTTANVRNGTTFGASSGSTGTLVVPTVGNVRSGITFDNGSTGTLVVPSANDVRNGTAFDTASIGNLVSPGVADVRSGTTFGSSSGLTGTLNLPAVGNVRSGVTYDNATKTGTVVIPSVTDVRDGTTFDTASTGTLVVPVVGNVRSGITFGAGSTLTGTVVLPSAADVRNGVTFDTASTGTLVVPGVGDVRIGITFDNGSTGTLVVPVVGNVRSGITFDNGSTGILVVPVVGNVRSGITFDNGSVGTVVVPSTADVRNGVTFDVASSGTLVVPGVSDVRVAVVFDNGSTGLLNLPPVADVLLGVTFDNGAQTGTLVIPSIPTVPAASDVRSGVSYGLGGSQFTGTITLPLASEVLEADSYGAGGTEFTGTVVLPSAGDVRDGVHFGDAGSLLGTLVVSGGLTPSGNGEFYAKLAATAERLIATKGRNVTLRKVATEAAANDPTHPWRGNDETTTGTGKVVEITAKAVLLNYMLADGTSDFTKRGQKRALVAANGALDANGTPVDLRSFSQLIDSDSTVWQILTTKPLGPGSLTLLYEFGLKE